MIGELGGAIGELERWTGEFGLVIEGLGRKIELGQVIAGHGWESAELEMLKLGIPQKECAQRD